jgi:uncharacterized membrane protein
MTTLDWFGIVLLVFAGAMAFAAYRLSSQRTEKEKESNIVWILKGAVSWAWDEPD